MSIEAESRYKKRLKKLKRYEPLCRKLMKGYLDRGEHILTSWAAFAEAIDYGIIDEEVSHNVLLNAMAYGKLRGWLKAEWRGVGMTPWAGSARRQRDYIITELGKVECQKNRRLTTK